MKDDDETGGGQLPTVKNRRFKNVCRSCRDIKLKIGFVLCLGIMIGVGLPFFMEKFHWKIALDLRRECQLPADYRVECLPEEWSDQLYTREICEAKGCCWDVYESVDGQLVPHCFHSLPSSYGYSVLSEEYKDEECLPASGPQWSEVRSEIFNYHEENQTYSHYRSKKLSAKPLGRATNTLGMRVEVDYVSKDYFMARIFDTDGFNTFEPDPYLKYSSEVSSRYPNEDCKNDGDRQYDVRMAYKGQRFYLDALRRGDSERSIFNTDFGAFMFSNQYMEFTVRLPSSNVYGLGQGNRMVLKHSFKEGTTRTLFNQVPPVSTWDESNNETSVESWYGSHPFYICIEPDGKAHGVLFVHTSALEFTSYGVPALTIRTNGAGMKFYVFLGPTPKDVIRQLTSVVGKPSLPPSWALGHHVCRSFVTGINSATFDMINNTANLFEEKRIPHASDCVFEQVLGSSLSDSLAEKFFDVKENLESKGIKITLVHSPMILEDSRTLQDEGVLVTSIDGKPYTGSFKGSKVNYLDVFRNNQSYEWTKQRLDHLANRSMVTEFDGYILASNTPIDESEYKQCKRNKLNNPIFVPGASYNQTGPSSVLKGTLCLDACHKVGVCNLDIMARPTHYNLHNLYGHTHAENVFHAVHGGPNKPPFIVSLSTFTGSGRYGGHWGGLMEPSWKTLKISLVQMLEFNLYGIPLTGMPACGFNGEVDRDLCSRWAQLSAFQPLCITYRELNSTNEKMLHPYLDDSFVGSVAAGALQIRNALRLYFYTVFREASLSGDPVVRPIFYHWPTDSEALNIDEQFLWGDDLLISPVLHKETTTLRAYFPEATWYDFYDGTLISKGSGSWKTINALEYHINIHIRGGAIVASLRSFNRGDDLRKLKLQVALDQRALEGETILARDELFLEDVTTVDGSPFVLTMEATENSVTLTPSEIDGIKPNQTLKFEIDAVYVLGIKKDYINCLVLKGGDTIEKVSCKFNSIQGVLSLTNLGLPVTESNYTLFWNETSSTL